MTEQKKELDERTLALILTFQTNEATEHLVYKKIAKLAKNQKNKETLEKIADDEDHHAKIWYTYSQKKVKPRKFSLFLYPFLAKVLGITFAVKLMEKGEEQAQHNYQRVLDVFPETKKIFDDENRHEHELIEIIDEEKLNYLGSIVLGLNDALVELTGALAGLSFALQQTKLIALAGLITGIAAAMSMAGSEYLSKKTEKDPKALRASVYTGLTYLATVLLLVSPYLIFNSYKTALTVTLAIGIVIIFCFTFFSATVQDQSFKKKFFEMTAISLGVAAISFLISIVLKQFLGVDV
ncbi:MAG: VIT1/CCC1 transporter family protein [Candidatus Buchananbacteria bacterium]|nr:VIT1/CCC1 transporter family protein [Candidatus Buchananbacteria bacterium]